MNNSFLFLANKMLHRRSLPIKLCDSPYNKVNNFINIIIIIVITLSKLEKRNAERLLRIKTFNSLIQNVSNSMTFCITL